MVEGIGRHPGARLVLASGLVLWLAAPASAQGGATDSSGGADGWTALAPGADSRLIYVSSSLGDDSLSGLSANSPKRTLAAGYQLLRDGFPDWLLLRRGDIWFEAFPSWTKSGRSQAEPMVLAGYGVGERPLINTGSSTGIGGIVPAGQVRGHLAFTDVHLQSGARASGDDNNGFYLIEAYRDVLIENCMIEGYGANIVVQQFEADRPDNIRIRRNVVVDAYGVDATRSLGIYLAGMPNLLVEENVFDHNGWLEDGVHNPDQFGQNLYIQYDCANSVVRNNVTARAANNGLSLRALNTVATGNVALANSVGIVLGSGVDQPPVASGLVTDNLVLDSRAPVAGYPNFAWGISFDTMDRLTVNRNIVAHLVNTAGTTTVGILFARNPNHTMSCDGNIVYDWCGGDPAAVGVNWGNAGPTVSAVFTNTTIQMPTGGVCADVPASVALYHWSGGRYFTLAGTASAFAGASYAAWLDTSHESGSSFAPVAYPDSNRTVGSYMASLGGTPSLEGFLAEARKQSRANWRTQYTATALNNYIRAGFGLGPVVPCPADINGDGFANINDFVAFMALYAAGDRRADVNHDGQISINDFLYYLNAFAVGCT